MKRLDLAFLALRLPLDYFAVFFAAVVSYFLRFQTFAEWRPATTIVAFPTYIVLAAAGAGMWVTVFALTRLYAPGRIRTLDEIARIFVGCSAALAVLVLVIFFRRELFASRFIILAVWGLSIVFVFVERMLLRTAQTYLYRKGIGSRKIAIIGAGRAAEAVADELAAHPTMGYEVRGIVADLSEKSMLRLRRMRGDARGLEEVFLAEPQVSSEDVARLLEFSDAQQVAIRYAADLLAGRRGAFDVAMFGGVPFVEIRRTPLSGWGRIYKRAFDLAVAACLIVLLSPVLALIALVVLLDSRGPVVFRQRRIGERGDAFWFHKFRSMHAGAEQDWAALAKKSDRPGPVPKIKDDPRVTRVGRFLRRWSLDELPQLFDVLAGSMSLVGPRPHLPEEVARYTTAQRRVLMIRPGVTGLAQISGRADLSFDDEVKLDVSYIERWSPKLDLSVLFKTPLAVISKKGAY